MSTTPSLAGQLADFDLPQLLTILQVARCTGQMEMSAPAGKGRLYLRAGAIIAAEAGTTRGELAAYELLSWNEGEFHYANGPVAVARDIERSNESLFLNGMRLIDEGEKGDVAFARQPEAAPALPSDRMRQVFEQVHQPTTIAAVAGACGLSRLETYYRLEQLEQLGALIRCRLDRPKDAAEPSDGRIRVLIVDDSSLMRKVLKRLYESDPGLTVVGVAEDGQQALDMLAKARPDVISLDLYMPVLDGVATLKQLMLTRPTPTVVMTSASPESLDLTFESILRFGAIDFITKPSQSRGAISEQEAHILRRLHKVARANLRVIRMSQPSHVPAGEIAARGRARGLICTTGGTGACLSYMQLLSGLPPDLPFGVVGTLSLPDEFLKVFAAYMNKGTPFAVEVARDGAPIQSGVCYVASEAGAVRIVEGSRGPLLKLTPNAGSPPAGPLFSDAAALFGDMSVGLLLSGEGAAALPGLAAIRAAGGVTLAQLPASCVDPEQCERAREQGAADELLLLADVASHLSHRFMDRIRRPERHAEPGGAALWPRRSA